MPDTEESISKKLLPWLAPAVLAGTLIAGFVRAEGQINTNTSSIRAIGELDSTRHNELKGLIDANDNRLDFIDLQRTERGGQVALEIERLRLQQEVQADKLDEVLQLLRSQ